MQHLQQQLEARGLVIVGACERLSTREALLQVSPLLRDFTPAEADLLGAAMLRIRAEPGQQLIAEGEASDWMMVLLQGTVDVGKRQAGTPFEADMDRTAMRLAVVKEGAVIGEMSMLDGEPRYASCWALSQVEAAVLGRADVARLIADHPAVGAKLLVKLTQLLAQRLRNTSSKLVKALHEPTAAQPAAAPTPAPAPSGPGPGTA